MYYPAKAKLTLHPGFHNFVKFVLLALCSLLFLNNAQAEDEAAREMRLKASFIYNMAKFVDWPDRLDEKPPQPISICFLHVDQWRWLIDESLQNKRIHLSTSAIDPHAESKY